MSRHEVQSVVDSAVREAIVRRHEYITVEHLLYSLLQHDSGSMIIEVCDGDSNEVLREMVQFFEEHIPELPVSPPSNAENGKEADEPSPVQTLGFRRVLERAMNQVVSSGKAEIEVGDLLAAIMMEQDSHAVYALKKQGIDRGLLLEIISHGDIELVDDEHLEESDPFDDDDDISFGSTQKKTEKPEKQLAAFTTNVTEMARQEKLDPLIGRSWETRRIVQVLCRRLKHNAVLVGEPGVGKTAIIEGLAQQIVQQNVPAVLQTAEIYSLDMGSLLAGTKFRGQFEKRLKTVLNAVKKLNDQAESGFGAILFIDEIHMIVGAGATSGTSVDASGLIKRALHEGNLRCIGTTTHEEYRRHFENDRALVRRFQKVEVGEPSVDESIQILHGLRPKFEDYYQIAYTDHALERAANLAFQHIAERFLPDKAIDVIDEAGALNQIRETPQQKTTLDVDDIEEVVTEIAHIPDLNPGETERDQLANLQERMLQKVFGQDKAIAALVSAITLARAGLGLPDKPVGAFLFAGPTGVGKTEVAKQLALTLGIAFKRFDMSEYMEKHAVSRLIGAPPGYVGFDQGGLLTETIRKNPHCVLLLDEIEKAHMDLFDILLQVMDHATLTDNTGREADFRHVILIMTSNAGAREMGKRVIGFEQDIDMAASKHAIEHLFSPEFRNRLTETVFFDALSHEIMERVVDKFIVELNEQLTPQHITVQLTGPARSWLAKHGYDEMYGARPLARLIQTTIRQPLAQEILFGKLQEGGAAAVSVKDDALVVKAE